MSRSQIKEFARFQDLFIRYDIKLTKKFSNQLEKDAIEWFKDNFNAKFSIVDSKSKYAPHTHCWSFQGGLLIFKIKGMGDYYYKWMITRLHFQHWKTREWKEGLQYGFNTGSIERCTMDDNPYPEPNFYAHHAWDCGYLMGLDKYFDKNKS